MVILCALRAYHGPRLPRGADPRAEGPPPPPHRPRPPRAPSCADDAGNHKRSVQVMLQVNRKHSFLRRCRKRVHMYHKYVHKRHAHTRAVHIRKCVNIARGVSTALQVNFRLTRDSLLSRRAPARRATRYNQRCTDMLPHASETQAERTDRTAADIPERA